VVVVVEGRKHDCVAAQVSVAAHGGTVLERERRPLARRATEARAREGTGWRASTKEGLVHRATEREQEKELVGVRAKGCCRARPLLPPFCWRRLLARSPALPPVLLARVCCRAAAASSFLRSLRSRGRGGATHVSPSAK
jgi:hypothetical protein